MNQRTLEETRDFLIDQDRRRQQRNRRARLERRKIDPDRVDPSDATKPKVCKCGGPVIPAEDGLPRRCLTCGKLKP